LGIDDADLLGETATRKEHDLTIGALLLFEDAVVGRRLTDLFGVGASASPSVATAGLDELFVRWQQTCDQCARTQLVERFMPLARKLARRYAGREPFDDLLQCGVSEFATERYIFQPNAEGCEGPGC